MNSLFKKCRVTSLLLVATTVTTFSMNAQAQGDKNAVCQLLPKQNAAQNVVYQAGVDAYGNAVVPADMNAAPMDGVLNMVKVPLNMDLARRVSTLTGQGIEMNAPLGMLEVHENGQVKYNGEDWTQPILTLCGQSYKQVTVNEVMVPNSQAMPEAVAPVVETITSQESDEVQILRQEVEALKNELAMKSAQESVAIPQVSVPTQAVVPQAPKIEFLDEVSPTKDRMANMDRPKLSEPASPIKPLVGIPKVTSKLEKNDIIQGQDHRNYNE